MNTFKEIRKENKYLQREIYLLLSSDRFTQAEKTKLQSNFIKNYYDIIKLSFDINISKETLNKYSKEIKNINHPKNLLRISRVVENENTYILLNRYLRSYLQLI